MSYRIYRAMGWGMPYERFKNISFIPDDDDLYDHFSKLTDQNLTVDDKIYRALFYGDGPRSFPIIQKRLLATGYDDGNTRTPAGPATDLFATVSTPDDTTDVIFFPNLYYRKKWYRWDNELDYSFELYRSEADDYSWKESQQSKRTVLDSNIDNGPRDFTKYVSFGHYPWTNSIMDLSGNPLPWNDNYCNLNTIEWLPDIPSEIRWYLTQYGVLDQKGVNMLRPIVAQWWS